MAVDNGEEEVAKWSIGIARTEDESREKGIASYRLGIAHSDSELGGAATGIFLGPWQRVKDCDGGLTFKRARAEDVPLTAVFSNDRQLQLHEGTPQRAAEQQERKQASKVARAAADVELPTPPRKHLRSAVPFIGIKEVATNKTWRAIWRPPRYVQKRTIGNFGSMEEAARAYDRVAAKNGLPCNFAVPIGSDKEIFVGNCRWVPTKTPGVSRSVRTATRVYRADINFTFRGKERDAFLGYFTTQIAAARTVDAFEEGMKEVNRPYGVGEKLRAFVGRRVAVYWEHEHRFFEGVLSSFFPETDCFLLDYDDGDVDAKLDVHAIGVIVLPASTEGAMHPSIIDQPPAAAAASSAVWGASESDHR